jgi:thiazole synthase ThiGH ThiG subunit
MANNIDNAIEKGIDPITVRCAYAEATDNVCLAYAITHKPLEAPEAPAKKK